MAAPARRIRPKPSRYFSVTGSRSSRPRSASVATSREAVALWTSSARPSSVTPSRPLPRSAPALGSPCDRLEVGAVPSSRIPQRLPLARATLGAPRYAPVEPRPTALSRRTLDERHARTRAVLAGGRAQEQLRRGRRRRRRARSGHRLLPGAEPRHHRRRRGREGLARRRQHGPQHHRHPLQLPVGRERGDLRALAEALGGARGRARLRPPVQPARRAEPRARPGRRPDERCGGSREPAERRRRRVAGPIAGQGVLPDRERLARRALPGARRRRCSGGAASPDTTGWRGRSRAARSCSASTSWSTAR